MNAKQLLRDYEIGTGFKRGDTLRPKPDTNKANAIFFGEIIDDTVVVLEQSPLNPHEYTVIGERPNPREPSDRFIKFTINGHNWKKV